MELIQTLNEATEKDMWKIIPHLSQEQLEEIIILCKDSYYNDSISLLSDNVFDILMEKLQIIDPHSPILDYVGAPIKGKKVKLPYWMGSMDKIKTDETVIEKWIGRHSGPYVVSDKLDGISCLIVRKNGVIKLYTRGNGSEGKNITHLLEHIAINFDDVPEELDIAIRGELIMSVENFEKYSDEMANARNMVGGIVNSKVTSINADQARDVDFIAYEIIEPKYIPSKQFDVLGQWGFNVSPYDVYETIDLEILDAILKKRKKKSHYEIDGLIITDNKKHNRNLSGNPTYSFAYKGMTQTADTRVIEVIWTPSKDGILVPRIRFEKVRLSQVDIEYATGFNAKFVTENGIGPGAVITIIRSGDVIPYILGINKVSKKQILPSKYDFEWDKNEVNIVLTNADENATVIIKRITKFFANIDVEDISEGIITKLVSAGYDDIFKIISMSIDDFLELDGFQETLANKVYNNIHTKLEDIDVLKLMNASNSFGRGFGEKKLKKIMNTYPNIVEEFSASTYDKWYERISTMDGFAETTTSQFLDKLNEFKIFYNKFRKVSSVKKYKSMTKRDGLFKGQTIVFTGFRNKDWQTYIESEGGKVSSTVSKNTTLLVYNDGEESSSKYTKAKQLGIKTTSKSSFEKKYDKQ